LNELSGISGGSVVSGDLNAADSMSTLSTSKLDGNKELKRLTNELKQLKNMVQLRKTRVFESLNEKFLWEKPFIDYDIDSDGEDKEDLPVSWASAYSTVITQLIQPNNLDFLADRVGVCDEYMFNKLNHMAQYFSYVETWSLLENAARLFHYGRRALRYSPTYSLTHSLTHLLTHSPDHLRNLYVYAKVKKNARKSIRLNLKRRMRYSLT
jgi:hypothetical protein